MKKYYNLKLHRVLIDDLELIRNVDNSLKTRMFLKGLEESISELGVLMPLLVMQQEGEYKFTLIDGYKRLQILKKIEPDILAVNVLIAEGSAENMSFSVNRVRGELSKLYQALYLYNIMVQEKVSQEELARRFMLSKGEISKLLNVAKQPGLVKMVSTGMSMTAAKTLAMGVTALKPEQRAKQIKNVQDGLKYVDLSSRKFEKISKIMTDYIQKTHNPLDSRKLKQVQDYVSKNENFVNTDRIVNSLIDDSHIDNVEINTSKLLYAFKTICEQSDKNNFKYEINNNGTVVLKLKMSEEDFSKFRRMVGLKSKVQNRNNRN